MVNNSDKVYKFVWDEVDCITVKPSRGYISPGEEKDLEIMFFSMQPGSIVKELLHCSLGAINYNEFSLDMKDTTWDNRQTVTVFDFNRYTNLNERVENITDEQTLLTAEKLTNVLNITIMYSAHVDFCKYSCSLDDEVNLSDTFIYKTRSFDFEVKNNGKVPVKIAWSFHIDEEYPTTLDKAHLKEKTLSITDDECSGDEELKQRGPQSEHQKDIGKATLYSGSIGRESVDTWFEVSLPFQINPAKACLKPNETEMFKVTFAPLDAFYYRVRLKSAIDNLDPYDQNVSCKITAKSLIPYCHLDIEESDYLTSGRRKVTGITLPQHMTVLEFDVLGSGCYKKTFNVINPTSEAYEFILEMIMTDKPELIPVHCNKLKGFVEGGTSTDVTFTFSPTAPGVYESQWRFIIPAKDLIINILVVGLVREPDVTFLPSILVITNSLVGFTTTNTVMLKNNENECLKFEFKGDSLCDESGETPVIVEPKQGMMKPHSGTAIKISYTPSQDGAVKFKIFYSVSHMTKTLPLCINALSLSIRPKATYYLIGNEHILNSEAITNIHLDQTASTYERTIPFRIKNDGSATFFFDWNYTNTPVKKYLEVDVEPKNGRVTPGNHVECKLYFRLKQIPVEAYPITLSISDGPEYNIYLYAQIEAPLYHFSCKDFTFGQSIINAPDNTYKKNIAFVNDDKVPIILDLNFRNLPELFVDIPEISTVEPGTRLKIPIFFRPKQVKEYEFKLQFWINSLCEEVLTIKGEGVPLLFDLYEGCQKSFDLGPVKVGKKITRQIEVMNHSKVPIDATFIFREMYTIVEDTPGSETTSVCLTPTAAKLETKNQEASRVHMLQNYKGDKIREQIDMDIKNALSSLKVIPNKSFIRPHKKVPIKIQFKPIGMISNLSVQLNMKVFDFERPLVRLSGSATDMSLSLSQNSLQFGRVRRRGCKILKVLLMNKGDFGARFCWQPLISDEFKISPMEGYTAAQSNVTFTITFRPLNHNPFIKVWACCNIENYKSLEIVMHASCMDVGTVQNKTMYLECPVREVKTEHITVTNPSDDMWLILSEVSEGPFETLTEFNIEPNTTFDIPISFKPKRMGKYESQVLFSPLGDAVLFVTLTGVATSPIPNADLAVTIEAKKQLTQKLLVYNLTEKQESYVVVTELIKIIPDKFNGYYDIKHPEIVKVWGEAAATCHWTIACYEPCQMNFKVMFINQESQEYQFYNIAVRVNPSEIVATLTFEARAREIVQQELIVANPLANDAVFDVQCGTLECPDILEISKNSETKMIMSYSPLVVGSYEDLLVIKNETVGAYVYKVLLTCLPAKEKNFEFSTPLGTCIPLRLRIQNKTTAIAHFITTVSHPSILAEKEYTLGPSEKGKFLVWFEPTEIGLQICKLSFKSSSAGEFVFNISGIGTAPKPQGPFDIKPGGYTSITFKNVFENTRMFKITTDRQDFYVKSACETIKSKTELKIEVYLNRGYSDEDEMPTGSLTIECLEPPLPVIHWTYFLQGIH